jgi:hypothetical protein
LRVAAETFRFFFAGDEVLAVTAARLRAGAAIDDATPERPGDILVSSLRLSCSS